MTTSHFTTTIKSIATILATAALLVAAGCSSDDPVKEDTPEMITQAKFTFTPTGGGAPVVVTATDPDGTGIADLTIDGPAKLTFGTTYKLQIELFNTLAEPTDAEYNISNEVAEEGDEHMFFFGWTGIVFSNPAGNGNIDNRNDAVNYTGDATSTDANNLPLGLVTTWTTRDDFQAAVGKLRILLKHQPELKSGTSDSNIGETDLDVTIEVTIGV